MRNTGNMAKLRKHVHVDNQTHQCISNKFI